jgi:hypothetical protein
MEQLKGVEAKLKILIGGMRKSKRLLRRRRMLHMSAPCRSVDDIEK